MGIIKTYTDSELKDEKTKRIEDLKKENDELKDKINALKKIIESYQATYMDVEFYE